MHGRETAFSLDGYSRELLFLLSVEFDSSDRILIPRSLLITEANPIESVPNFWRTASIVNSTFSIRSFLAGSSPKRDSCSCSTSSVRLMPVIVSIRIGEPFFHELFIISKDARDISEASQVGEKSCFWREITLKYGSLMSTLIPQALRPYFRSLPATVSDSPLTAMAISLSETKSLLN